MKDQTKDPLYPYTIQPALDENNERIWKLLNLSQYKVIDEFKFYHEAETKAWELKNGTK